MARLDELGAVAWSATHIYFAATPARFTPRLISRCLADSSAQYPAVDRLFLVRRPIGWSYLERLGQREGFTEL